MKKFYYNFMFLKYLWLKIIFVPFCLWKLHAVGQSIQAYLYEAPIDWNFHIILKHQFVLALQARSYVMARVEIIKWIILEHKSY
jgi:hypothetical protein